jgi:hypothetical protein
MKFFAFFLAYCFDRTLHSCRPSWHFVAGALLLSVTLDNITVSSVILFLNSRLKSVQELKIMTIKLL